MAELINRDPQLTIRIIADELELDEKSVKSILVNNLNMQTVHVKTVPRFANQEQKARRLNVCQDNLPQLEADDKISKKIITGGESWIFRYDLESKRQSRQWKTASPPRPKARM